MRKQQHRSLKLHTLFSIILAIVFVVVIAIVPEYSLFGAAGFLVMYVAGNGIIHYKKNRLSRDTLIEYVLVSLAALVVLIGALL